MASFKDKQGREWQLELDAPLCRAAKQLGVDLVNLKQDPIAQLELDPLLLADVAWLLVRSQAENKRNSITVDDFQGALNGEANTAFIEAIKDAIVNFSPAGKRSLVRSQQAQNAKVQTDAEEMAIQKMTTIHPRIAKAMEKKISQAMETILSDLESTLPSNTTADNSHGS